MCGGAVSHAITCCWQHPGLLKLSSGKSRLVGSSLLEKTETSWELSNCGTQYQMSIIESAVCQLDFVTMQYSSILFLKIFGQRIALALVGTGNNLSS